MQHPFMNLHQLLSMYVTCYHLLMLPCQPASAEPDKAIEPPWVPRMHARCMSLARSSSVGWQGELVDREGVQELQGDGFPSAQLRR